MKGLNMKEVCKQIKYYGKRSLLWSRQNGFHYITNRHWMIRFTEEQLPREVLVILFSIFAKIPEDGKMFSTHAGTEVEMAALNVESIYAVNKETAEGKITPFIKDLEFLQMRAIQCQDRFIYVNEQYVRMVDFEEKPVCSGQFSPLIFLEGALVLLPYRAHSADDKTTLEALVAS